MNENFKEKEKEEEDQGRTTKADVVADRSTIADDLNVCEKAPEWAEHQRWHDDDQPCDDGRSGRLEDQEDIEDQ